MDIVEIKKFIQLMKANQLTEFELEDQGFRISIKRHNGSESPVVVAGHTAPVMMGPPLAPAAPAALATPVPAAKPASTLPTIKSPMVGTFYRSPAPDAEPFVTVGQSVDKETVVCIVEAMKVMNEIKAEMKGMIKKILVENATPVQFGQPLFEIEPA